MRSDVSRPAASRATDPIRFLLPFLIVALMLLGSRASGSPSPPEPLVAPTVDACEYYATPSATSSLACEVDNLAAGMPAFVGAAVRFNVTVSGADAGEDIHVTFRFDHFLPNFSPNPDSPTQTFIVPWPGAGQVAYVETAWTYTRLSNFTSQYYWIRIEARGADGEFADPAGSRQFRIYVTENSSPSVRGGLQSVYESLVDFPDPEILPIYVNVTVGDFDGDALVITWDWGDGTTQVVETEPSFDPVPMNVVHVYDPSVVPLNQTPRVVRFSARVSVDDRLPGHNVTESFLVEFNLEIDSPPQVQSIPTPNPGSRWKVNETVPMQSIWLDPEGDPLTIYWDFDAAVDTDGDGTANNDRDALGPDASHVYAEMGNYTLTVWATDGVDKRLCLDSDCTTSDDHWTDQEISIVVRANVLPRILIGNQTAVVGEPVSLRVVVFDADGDSLLITWDFGDGSPTVENTTIGTRGVPQTWEVFQVHTYPSASLCPGDAAAFCAGRYNLTVTASDGNDTVNATLPVVVESFDDPPAQPILALYWLNETGGNETLELAEDNQFLYDTVVAVQVNLTLDQERDAMAVTVTWSDGNVTRAAVALLDGNVSVIVVDGTDDDGCQVGGEDLIVCFFYHRYGDIGTDDLRDYTILVSVTDNKAYLDYCPDDPACPEGYIIRPHTKSGNLTVSILHPRLHGPGPWDVWDVGTLGVVLGIPAVLLGRAAWRIRRERREE